MQDSSITLVGNLTADPLIRVVGSGISVCSFRIGCTPRWRERSTGSWTDGPSTFWAVTTWRSLADNVAATLHRGDRVVVLGRVRLRTYTTAAGDERSVYEVEADTVAPDLGRHQAVLSRPLRMPGADIPTAATTPALAAAEPAAQPALPAGPSPVAAIGQVA